MNLFYVGLYTGFGYIFAFAGEYNCSLLAAGGACGWAMAEHLQDDINRMKPLFIKLCDKLGVTHEKA